MRKTSRPQQYRNARSTMPSRPRRMSLQTRMVNGTDLRRLGERWWSESRFERAVVKFRVKLLLGVGDWAGFLEDEGAGCQECRGDFFFTVDESEVVVDAGVGFGVVVKVVVEREETVA
ncbi:hypothetical protein BCR34DRAFT_594000 [Clohesyomyces aquaticus]|uniref:Uncharacterized protein n=1 Tax=Clohesyomyces aquaticus TaxID=1231657 RepID=A0A1Y1YDB4_9PLEO|nr:hypothetical protein BCR34DRAFT_594000 [Clohesyomyces aquaticus]